MLSALLMLSLFSCDNSSITSESSSLSDETSENAGFVWSPNVEKIQSYFGNDIDRNLLANDVFLDRPYTVSRPNCESYPDPNGEKLTNGASADIIYGPHTFAGWEGNSSVNVTFDLGEERFEIADISVGCARIIDYYIGLPKYVSVKVSNDGKVFTEIARINTPSDVDRTTKYTYYFSFPKAVTARYFQIHFNRPESGTLCVDEIMAFEYSENGTFLNTLGQKIDVRNTITDFYNYDLNLGESDVKISESDKDFNEIRNLATIDGVEFQIQHFDPLFAGHSNSGMEKISMLNDGKRHGSDIERDYFIFYRGGGRHVIADLGTIMAVSGCNLSFRDKYTWGMTTPPVYYISVSENGTDWVTVFAEDNPEYGKKEREKDDRVCDFGKEVKARYVRLTFETVPENTISSSVYMGEFEIIGRKNPSNAVTATEDKSIIYGRYPDPSEYGISDILFTGVTDEYGVHCTEHHVMNEDTTLKYLAILDENGNATERFMDSFAFTTRHPLNEYAKRDEGFAFFLDELFYEGVNINAVETMQAKVNKDLGKNEKCKIWISVNCPIIGDYFKGKEIKTAEDYIECLKWQADEAIKRFNEQNYKNVELAGFYWQSETMRPNYKHAPAEAHDYEAAAAFNEYIHSRGYLSLWCPYYDCAGLYFNKVLGFDITCLQPNLMWYSTEGTRITTSAERAKLYGCGIEIEIEHSKQGDQSFKLYRDYLGTGVDYGYIDAINAYYQGAVPGAYIDYRDDTDELTKAIWDETLLYVTGRLDTNYNNLAEPYDLSHLTDGEITVSHGRTASCQIGSLNGLTYRFSQTAAYGSVALDESGKLKYTAMDGYKGKDTVTVTVFDGIYGFKTVTVDITVTE